MRLARLLLPMALLGLMTGAMALECPGPPEQAHRDWDAAVKAEVAKMGSAKGANIDAQVKVVTKDLLAGLPNADRVYLEQMMFATYCSALRDDTHMPADVKAERVLAWRRALDREFGAAKPPVAKPASGAPK